MRQRTLEARTNSPAAVAKRSGSFAFLDMLTNGMIERPKLVTCQKKRFCHASISQPYILR